MSRALTKAEMAVQLEQSNVSYAKLVAERDGLLADIAALKAGLAKPQASTPLRPGQRVRPTYEPSAEVLARRAAMAVARAEAMRSGRSVLVSAR